MPATHSNTLTGFDGGAATRQTHLMLQDGRLRTLTLTEWEARAERRVFREADTRFDAIRCSRTIWAVLDGEG